jgi:hypothetical protein
VPLQRTRPSKVPPDAAAQAFEIDKVPMVGRLEPARHEDNALRRLRELMQSRNVCYGLSPDIS